MSRWQSVRRILRAHSGMAAGWPLQEMHNGHLIDGRVAPDRAHDCTSGLRVPSKGIASSSVGIARPLHLSKTGILRRFQPVEQEQHRCGASFVLWDQRFSDPIPLPKGKPTGHSSRRSALHHQATQGRTRCTGMAGRYASFALGRRT
jgi:hypothetical protein